MEVDQVGDRHELRMADAERLIAVDIGLLPAASGRSVVAEQFEIDLTMRTRAIEEKPADQARDGTGNARRYLKRNTAGIGGEGLRADDLRTDE